SGRRCDVARGRSVAARAWHQQRRACVQRSRVWHRRAGGCNCSGEHESNLALGGDMINRRLTLALMDPPYESANSTTALRIISAALEKGIDVNVFAYEGAVCLPL